MNPSAVGANGRLPLAAAVRCVFRGQERGGRGGEGSREFGPPAAALGRLSSESSGVEDKLCMRFSLSLSLSPGQSHEEYCQLFIS